MRTPRRGSRQILISAAPFLYAALHRIIRRHAEGVELDAKSIRDGRAALSSASGRAGSRVDWTRDTVPQIWDDAPSAPCPCGCEYPDHFKEPESPRDRDARLLAGIDRATGSPDEDDTEARRRTN